MEYIKKEGEIKVKSVLKKAIVTISIIMLSFCSVIVTQQDMLTYVEAHSGRTDSNGGHHDNKNKSGLGSYHYHCGGHPAHLHENGVCPYDNSKSASSSSRSKSKKSKYSKELVKKVQTALNDLGYDCGKVDGIYGKKTKAAIKKFQKDNNLKVDGIIGKQLKKALNI